MRPTILGIFLGLLLPLFSACSSSGSETQEKEAITALVDRYIESINNADGEIVNEIWMHDDHVSFIAPMGRYETYNEIRDKMVLGVFGANFTQRNLQKTDLKINLTSPTTAYCEFSWTFEATRNDGGLHQAKGRETQIMRKVDGEWKLEHIHYSAIP